jgi:hypothetical protein
MYSYYNHHHHIHHNQHPHTLYTDPPPCPENGFRITSILVIQMIWKEFLGNLTYLLSKISFSCLHRQHLVSMVSGMVGFYKRPTETIPWSPWGQCTSTSPTINYRQVALVSLV